MAPKAEDILRVLDDCCANFSFPALDNGYFYLAATRLSLHRSDIDWGLVIEVFGFSPRAGLPATHVHTFGNRLCNRNPCAEYTSLRAYEDYLSRNPHNDTRVFYPVEPGDWQDPDDLERVFTGASEIVVRGIAIPMPSLVDLIAHGIEPRGPHHVRTYELCRYLAAINRDAVLATPHERRVSIRPEMDELLVLQEWNHPNVCDDSEYPSGSITFRQLANVLESGDAGEFRPTLQPNTHWKNWPQGGTL